MERRNLMKFTTRQIILMSLLAATNGVLEITLGNYFHAIHFFFTGNIMIGFNCIVYITGKKVIPQRGSILIIGFISSLLKFLFGWSISAAAGIFMESLLIELALNIIGFNLAGTITGSILANIWAFLQKIIVAGILGGKGFLYALIAITDRASLFFHINKEYIFLLVIVVIFFYSLWGAVFGIIGWSLTDRFSGSPEFNLMLKPERKN
jgi:hypothetical protein